LLPSPSSSRTTFIAFGITLALASLSHATPVTVIIALIAVTFALRPHCCCSPATLVTIAIALFVARHHRAIAVAVAVARPPPFFAITIAIFVPVAITIDSPLCHAPPSHLSPNVDCHLIAVTIALATLAVALFAPRRLPLSSHLPSPTPSM
jgi:hypothetical protein